MEPTLKIDDRVLVVKDTIVQLDITSGDIVVFYNNDSEHPSSFFQEYIDGLQIWKISDINSQENILRVDNVDVSVEK